MLKVGIFNVRVVLRGDKYGRDDSVTHDGDDPLVEFYDAIQDPDKFGDRGQFISRYFSNVILSSAGGLNLYGGVPTWYVYEEQMRRVRAYLQGFADGRAQA